MSDIRPTTRQAVIEAAFEVLNQNPGASLADIAVRAGVGRATLHRHFASRYDLVVALAETAANELDKAVDLAVRDARSYGEALRLALVAIIPLADKHLFLASEPVERDPRLAERYARDRHDIVDAVEKAKAEGVFDPSVPSAWIASAYDAQIYAAWTMVKRQEATPRQAADFAWRLLTHGASNDR